MNRLQLFGNFGAASAPSANRSAGFLEIARASLGEHAGVAHALFAPMHYEANYAYPLLIWLHGPNDDERQLQRIMPLLSLRNYVAVGPRGTTALLGGQPGFGWDETSSGLSRAEQQVFDVIEIARNRFNIAPNRVFLAGLESGGAVAYRIAAQNPRQFAGVLSVGGPFPSTGNPLAKLADLRHVPLFIAQGRESQRYSVDRLCDDLRLMHSAGLNITVRQYPCGDELNTQMLRDMDAWLMEIVTGKSTRPQPPPVPTNDWN